MRTAIRTALVAGGLLVVPSLRLAAAAPPEHAAGIETFDLAKLAPGETKTFGEGDHAVTASRQGDDVVITLKDAPDGGEKTIRCRIGDDNCHVLTTTKGGAGTMLFLGSEGEKSLFTGTVLDADGGGDGVRREVVVVHKGDGSEAPGEGETTVVESGGGTAHVKVLRLGGEGNVLRCPEGDTTMTVKKEDLAAGYRCPKHNLALEEVKGARVMRKVVVETTGSGDKKK